MSKALRLLAVGNKNKFLPGLKKICTRILRMEKDTVQTIIAMEPHHSKFRRAPCMQIASARPNQQGHYLVMRHKHRSQEVFFQTDCSREQLHAILERHRLL